MRTYQRLPRFDIDWETLTPTERQRFRAAVGRFIEDLEAGRPFRAGLRVKGVQGTANVMEMTFAPDGRSHPAVRDRGETGRAACRVAPDRHARDLPVALTGPLRRRMPGYPALGFQNDADDTE